MKTIRIFLFFAILAAFSHETQAAKVTARVAVGIANQNVAALKVQESVTINQSTIPERSVTAAYNDVTQAYVQNTLEQAHAMSSHMKNFAGMLNASSMVWVLAALVLLLFARL